MLFYGLFRVHTERGRDKRETRRSRKRSERSDKRLLVTHPGECKRGSFIIDIKVFFWPLPRLEVSFLRGIEVTRLSRRLRAREEVNGSWKFFPFSGGGRIVETYRIRRFVDTVKCLSADFYRDCVRLDSIENFRQFRPRNTAVPAPPPRTTTPFFPSLFNVLPPR